MIHSAKSYVWFLGAIFAAFSLVACAPEDGNNEVGFGMSQSEEGGGSSSSGSEEINLTDTTNPGSSDVIGSEGGTLPPPTDIEQCTDTCMTALECLSTDDDCRNDCQNHCGPHTFEGCPDCLEKFTVPGGYEKVRFEIEACHQRAATYALNNNLRVMHNDRVKSIPFVDAYLAPSRSSKWSLKHLSHWP